MRKWAKSTSRAALVAAGALTIGAAFGSGAAAGAAASYGGGGHGGGVDMTSFGNIGVLNGNQVFAPISMPINVCGNAVAIAGLAQAQCKGGASVSSHRSGAYRTAGGWAGGWDGGWDGGGDGWEHGKSVHMQTAGNFGVANGNQVYAPIKLPINVCGNAVAVLGLARAQCEGGASVKGTGGRDVDMKSAGNFGLLNGNQFFIPISVPINVCGNAVAVLGLAEAQCKGGASVGGGHHEPPHIPWKPVKKHKKHKKHYKPSKHRPAAKHKKLPSTLRADGHRTADTGVNYRTADGLPGVQQLLATVGSVTNLGGVNLRSGQVGPRSGAGAPVRIGSPVLH
ncbi:chaplin family protein [Actinomadura bangladeshensis]|nr:chaplin family protein [Actinomadura bangladeshensis]